MFNQKPCPVAPRQGSSESDQLDSTIKPQIATPQRISQVLLSEAITVSDGRAMLGYIVEVDDTHVAVTPDGITIGTFRRRQQAFKAISEHRIP